MTLKPGETTEEIFARVAARQLHLIAAHQLNPNLRDLFHDLLIERLDDHWQNQLPIFIIMEAFDIAVKTVKENKHD